MTREGYERQIRQLTAEIETQRAETEAMRREAEALVEEVRQRLWAGVGNIKQGSIEDGDIQYQIQDGRISGYTRTRKSRDHELTVGSLFGEPPYERKKKEE